jgi:hypothetical protein
MEVHAHTHTPRKKWTHYFWEFFMLFLAVTLGFFVENQREHYVEHHREKQYAFSMVDDLKLDTAALNRIILLRTNRIKIFDSLFLLLKEPIDTNYLSDIYFYSRITIRNATIHFIYNDGTMQQLKNSGGLRLIRNRIVSDNIVQYDSHVRRLEKIQEREEVDIQNFKNYCSKIFNGHIYNQMMTKNKDNIPRRPPGNPALLGYTKENLNDLITGLHYMKSSNNAYIRFSGDLYDEAAGLLNTINKAYHLE